MKLVEFVPPVSHPLWKLCLQMGITDVVVKVHPTLTGLADPWRYETLSKIVGGLKEAGLTVVGLEGDPFDMSPIKEFGNKGEVVSSPLVSEAQREAALSHYCELLESMAKHFGKRVAFIHVRDVEGDRHDFTELFHDQGTTDQFALMRTYRALGLDVPMRGDHVPEMEGDRLLSKDCIPGYFTLGRLFANGYLKALLVANSSRTG